MLIRNRDLHPWDVGPKDAISIQNQIRKRVICEDGFSQLKTVAGADVTFDKGDDMSYASVVVMSYPELEIREIRYARRKVTFPYVPGLLAFREAPVLLDALDRVEYEPDVIIFDGQGLAHQRRMGIATHVGILVDKPSIGCAKSRLVGLYKEPRKVKGTYSKLTDRGEVIGVVLCTKDNIAPLFISIGHKISLKSSIEIILACCTKYRLPEPTRQAHNLVNGLRRGENVSEYIQPSQISTQEEKGEQLSLF